MNFIVSIVLMASLTPMGHNYPATCRIDIPPGGYRVVYYDKETHQIKENEVTDEIQGLPDKAIEAIVKAPQWIRKDLIKNLIELYKIPIEVGKDTKIAFADVSEDGKEDLIVKLTTSITRCFIAPYWKEETPKINVAIDKFENIIYQDITDDGIRDMVGVSEDGKIYFRKNFGTNDKPYYLTYTNEQKKMFNLTDAGRLVSPVFADLNNDKIADLLIGNKNGEIKIYYGPDFKKSNVLPVKVEGYSKPVLCDLNKDGAVDLVVGCADGKLYAFMGPDWKENISLFKDVKVPSNSAPAFCDIDNNGDLEICVGSGDSKIYLFENTKDGYVQKQGVFDHINCGAFANPCFYDFNNDEKKDLIIGNIKGEISVFTAPDWKLNTTILSMARIERCASPCFYDIDNDGAVELAVGTLSGLIMYFENENGEWREYDSWQFKTMTGIETINDYYDRYYPEKEELLGTNDTTTLMAYVDLLNEVEKKYIDEVAFSIAETPSEILRLMNKMGNKDLLVENVRMIYTLAESLNYVKIVEEKDYTTLSYAIKKDLFKPIPRDIYYWWVVHPCIYLDIPAKVDASYWAHDWKYYGIDEEKWTRDTGKLKIYQHTKDASFWRSFLPFDTKYGPSLISRVKDSPTLMHALCRISQFTYNWLPGGLMTYGRRSNDLQPMIIYMKAYGSCGEQAILYTACLRSLLIPTSTAGCSGEDHIWSEYWLDGDWYTFGYTSRIGTPAAECNGEIATITKHWGNGFTEAVTEKVATVIPGAKKGYTAVTELNIRVVDSLGKGVDGAMVLLRSHRMQEKNLSHHGYTDNEGMIKFNVGLGSRNDGVFVDVISPFGTGGITKFIATEGKNVNYTIKLPGVADYYKDDILIKEEIPNTTSTYQATVNFKVLSECQYPQNISTGIRKRPDSELAKEFGYLGTRTYPYPNQEMNGIYVYLTDNNTVKNLMVSGFIESEEIIERKTSGEISKWYAQPDDMVVVFFNKNSIRTNVEVEYTLSISNKEPKAPEITMEKCPASANIGEEFIFRGKCHDNLGITRLMFSYNDGQTWQDITDTLDRKIGTVTYEWNTSNLIPNTYQVRFKAENINNLVTETQPVTIALKPSTKFNNIRIYQDNQDSPLPKSSWMLGPFKLPKGENFIDIETRAKDKFDMDMFLYKDKNGNRSLDGTQEEFGKSTTPTANEHIFIDTPNDSAVYWLYLQGWQVPIKEEQNKKIDTDKILTINQDDFRTQYQYAYLDLELSFEPQPIIIQNIKPVGIVYKDTQIDLSGNIIAGVKSKSFSVELDGSDITKALLWNKNSFSYKLDTISIAQEVTHTVKARLITEDGYEDNAEWCFYIKPKPEVEVRYEIDDTKEWMTILVDIQKNTNLKYVKFKIDEKGKWEDIPKNELKFKQYVWRIHGIHKIIVEYKIGNKIETIEKSFSIEHERIGFGNQIDDIVVFPEDGTEINNSMAPIDIYCHKRIGDIEEIQILLDGKKINLEISDYSLGKVAEYIPENPYQNGKHSVLVKIKTIAGKKIEKRIEFEIKPR